VTVPRPSPIGVYLVAIVCFCLGAISLGAACDHGQRQDTLRGLVTGLNAARDGFATWDGRHQQIIVDGSASREDAERKIAEWRAHGQRDVELGLTVAYQAGFAAATQSDELSLQKAIRAAADIIATVKSLIGGPP
jgi:hypothetical protein